MRIIVDGKTAWGAEQWDVGRRMRDVEAGPDGALRLLEDSSSGGLYRLTPT